MERKQWTHMYPNNSKIQVDFIFINKKWIYNTLNCVAYSFSEGLSSNDGIAMANIFLHRNKKQIVKTPQYEQSSLCPW